MIHNKIGKIVFAEKFLYFKSKHCFLVTFQDIKPGEELLTWFDPLSSRKQRKRRKVMRTSSTASSG